MNIQTLTGESLPTFKTATLTYKDTELFELQRNFEKENNTNFKSLLVRDNPVILGTGTKLEAVNEDLNKSAVKFTVSESYVSSFEYDFLKSIINNGSFSVIIGNYSDKNTVLTKIINAASTYNDKNILKMGEEELMDLIRNQSLNYYTDIFNDIFKTYKNLFDGLGIKNKIDLTSIKKSFDTNISEINDILSKNNVHDLNRQYNNIRLTNPSLPKVDITDELHFSSYNGSKGKITSLNQQLVDFYRIFSNQKNFDKFVELQENNLIEKFKYFNPTFGEKLNLVSKDNVKNYAEALGLDKNTNYEDLVTNGKLNPFLKK